MTEPEQEQESQATGALISEELDADEKGLELFLDYLHRSRGFDFSGYKRQTLTRRIQRRMQIVGQRSYASYIDFLRVRPEEFAQLFNAVLINVTGFFRDPDAWQELGLLVAKMIEEKESEEPIRAWTAGCASGEEAYSLAIVLAELLGIETVLNRVKIYATDLDEEALAQARLARYASKSLDQLPQALAERYFTPVANGYTFHKDLRRAVIFGRHDLLQDAPIARVDVLTCRNTLMYFNAEAQSRVLTRLHFALANRGIFFLGRAEMLLTHTALFTPIDLKLRLFRRASRHPRAVPRPQVTHADDARLGSLRRAAFDVSPVAQVILDSESKVALINPRAATLFALVEKDVGRPFHDLEMSYRPVELRSIIDRVNAEGRAITVKAVERVSGASAPSFLDIEVSPLRGDAGDVFGVHLAFTDCTFLHSMEAQLQKANLELVTAQEELQSTSEELETTNEELQSTVEELETTNEELQSTNEELETMNQELQSTNEELQTLNEELRQRSDSLTDSNTFLASAFEALASGVAVVDDALVVRAWNTAMEQLWGVPAHEAVGKSLPSLDIGLPVAELRSDLLGMSGAGLGSRPVHVLDGTNRRGKAVRCRCRIHGLADSAFTGAMLVVDEESQ